MTPRDLLNALLMAMLGVAVAAHGVILSVGWSLTSLCDLCRSILGPVHVAAQSCELLKAPKER